MLRSILISSVRILCAVLALSIIIGLLMAQPTMRENRPSTVSVDTEALKKHVITLSETFHPRDWTQVDNLDKCAGYIREHFVNAGADVTTQVFEAHGRPYQNVTGRFSPGRGSKLIIGAHYDAFEGAPGADDNASGVAVLIELAYLLGGDAPDREVELVAYSLEEPPFFRTPFMGSAVHAKSVAEEKDGITGMIALEMVGYFSDKRGSQSFPSSLMRLFYPSRGNFIVVVGRLDQGAWIKSVKTGMKGTTGLPVYSVRAPTLVPGIDFSDHKSYWRHGIPAVMITDTAFYRNKAYHSPYDTWDRLDYERMAEVVVALFEALFVI